MWFTGIQTVTMGFLTENYIVQSNSTTSTPPSKFKSSVAVEPDTPTHVQKTAAATVRAPAADGRAATTRVIYISYHVVVYLNPSILLFTMQDVWILK